MKISVNADVKDISRKLKNFERNRLPRLVQQSLNKTIDKTHTSIRKDIRDQVGIKNQYLKENYSKRILTKTKARNNDGRAYVTLRDKVEATDKFDSRRWNLIRWGIAGGKHKQGKKGSTPLYGKMYGKRVHFKRSFVWDHGKGEIGATVMFRMKDAEKKVPTQGRYAGKTIKRGPRRGQPIKRQPLATRMGPSLTAALERRRDRYASEARAAFKAELERRFAVEFKHA